MIVRVLTRGQYRLSDDAAGRLNELDNAVAATVDANDDDGFARALATMLEFVEREFEHPVIRAGLLFFNGLREVDLRLRGFGHHIPALLASPAKAQLCLGGSERLAEALAAAVREAGG